MVNSELFRPASGLFHLAKEPMALTTLVQTLTRTTLR
jgi:hypothetical protein